MLFSWNLPCWSWRDSFCNLRISFKSILAASGNDYSQNGVNSLPSSGFTPSGTLSSLASFLRAHSRPGVLKNSLNSALVLARLTCLRVLYEDPGPVLAIRFSPGDGTAEESELPRTPFLAAVVARGGLPDWDLSLLSTFFVESTRLLYGWGPAECFFLNDETWFRPGPHS